MENDTNLDTNATSGSILDNTYVHSLFKTTAVWSKFLAIIGFIAAGFMILGGLAMAGFGSAFNTSLIGGLSTAVVGLLYAVFALIYILPSYYLYMFSEKLRLSMRSRNEGDLIAAFERIKAFFKFCGILTLVMIIIYALFFIFAIGMQGMSLMEGF